MAKMTLKLVSLLLLQTSLLLTTGCGKSFDNLITGSSGEGSPDSTNDTYAESFYNNLIAGGMSASEAAHVSGYSPQSSSSTSMKLLLKLGILSSDVTDKARDSVAFAMEAVSDNSHFPNASDKQDAIEIISQAEFATLVELVDESELSSVMGDVADSMSSEVSATGLTGADLQGALERQGKGIAKGLVGSSIDPSIQDDVMVAFSQGAVSGLFNNPQLAASGVDLITALTQGLLGEIGNDNSGSLTAEGKGLIIREIIRGVQSGIDLDSNLSDEDKSSALVGIIENAQTVVTDDSLKSELNSVGGDVLYSSDQELHMISIYEAGPSSTPWGTDADGNLIPPTHWAGDATVNIADGTKPVVLVLVSYEAVNWHLTGAVSRVAKVVMHGFYNQTVDQIDASKVEMLSMDSGDDAFCGIQDDGDWFLKSTQIHTQALMVCMRQKTGAQLVSFQGDYDATSFIVGDGLNSPPVLPALTFAKMWVWANPVKVYDSAGSPTIYMPIYLSSAASSTITINVTIQHDTTNSDDIPSSSISGTVTIPAGSTTGYFENPFIQDEAVEGDESFKLILSTSSDVLMVTPSVSGTIID